MPSTWKDASTDLLYSRLAICRKIRPADRLHAMSRLSDIPLNDGELDKLMKPLANNPAIFQIDNEPVVQQRNAFKPFYSFAELERYRMYFDSRHRRVLW
jgi:hypothetical protein